MEMFPYPIVRLRRCDEDNLTGFDKLSDKIFAKIFGELNLSDLAAVRSVCPKWRNASNCAKIELILTSDVSDGGLLPNEETVKLLASGELRNLIFSVRLRKLDERQFVAVLPLLRKCENVRKFLLEDVKISKVENITVLYETIASFRETLETLHLGLVEMFGKSLFPDDLLPSKIKKLAFVSHCYPKKDLMNIICANKETLKIVKIDFFGEIFESEILEAVLKNTKLNKLLISDEDTWVPGEIDKYLGNDELYSPLRDLSSHSPNVIEVELTTNLCEIGSTVKMYSSITKLNIVKHRSAHVGEIDADGSEENEVGGDKEGEEEEKESEEENDEERESEECDDEESEEDGIEKMEEEDEMEEENEEVSSDEETDGSDSDSSGDEEFNHANVNFALSTKTLEALKNFPNVKEFSISYDQEDTLDYVVSSNVVKIASRFKELEILEIRCPWDENELDIFLLTFRRIPTLREIAFLIAENCRCEFGKWIKFSRKLTAEGRNTSFVRRDKEYYLIFCRSDEDSILPAFGMKRRWAPIVSSTVCRIPPNGYGELPDAVLLKVFKHLDLVDITSVRLVCKRWKDVSRSAKITLALGSMPNLFPDLEGEPDFDFIYPDRRVLKLIASPVFNQLITRVRTEDLRDSHLRTVLPVLQKCEKVREFLFEGCIVEGKYAKMLCETLLSLQKTLKTVRLESFSMAVSETLTEYVSVPPPSNIIEFTIQCNVNQEYVLSVLRSNKETLKTVEIDFVEVSGGGTFDEVIFETLSQMTNLKKLKFLASDLSVLQQVTGFFGTLAGNYDAFKFEFTATICKIRSSNGKCPFTEILHVEKECEQNECPYKRGGEHENINNLTRKGLKNLRNFPNVKKLRFSYDEYTEDKDDTISSNVLKIASQFEKVEVMEFRCPWDCKDLDIYLLAFKRVPTLRKIEFLLSIDTDSEAKYIVLARNLTAGGQRTSFVRRDGHYHLIICRKEEELTRD